MEVLNKVDAFYATSWSHLIYMMSGATAVVGVLVPMVLQYARGKEFKEISDRMVETARENEEINMARIAELEKRTEERVALRMKKMDEELKHAKSHGFFLQGIALLAEKSNMEACRSFIIAAEELLAIEDLEIAKQNLQAPLKRICKECLPRFAISDFSRGTSPTLDEDFNRLLFLLEKKNIDNRYHADILNLKDAISVAKKR